LARRKLCRGIVPVWTYFLLFLSDALFRRKIPVGPDALDADAPDAFYRHPRQTGILHALLY